MILLKLFWSFFQIGMFSIGGGYAAIPLIQEQAVNIHHWMTLSEFTDLITIAEMTPGPIAINSATFVGIRVAGLAGALTATLSCILPSLFLVTLLAKLYQKYGQSLTLQTVLSTLRPAVVALIAGAGLNILLLVVFGEGQDTGFHLLGAVLFFAAFLVLRIKKTNPIAVMLGCGVAYTCWKLITGEVLLL